MSARGKETAFISIGLSCQPALQLYRNRQHLASLVGEPLDYSSSFFNWLMLSADEIPRLLERMTAPIEASAIDLPAGERVPVLAGYRAWLFHDGPTSKITRKKFRQLVAKYEHLRQNFLELCARRTRHFVLCNAQNNLAAVHPHLSDTLTTTFDDTLIASIRAAVDRLFPAGRNRLLVVGRADRLQRPMRRHVRVPVADDTEWEGDTAAWAAILSRHLRPRGTASRPVPDPASAPASLRAGSRAEVNRAPRARTGRMRARAPAESTRIEDAH
jgi:hypothetical protein